MSIKQFRWVLECAELGADPRVGGNCVRLLDSVLMVTVVVIIAEAGSAPDINRFKIGKQGWARDLSIGYSGLRCAILLSQYCRESTRRGFRKQVAAANSFEYGNHSVCMRILRALLDFGKAQANT